MNYNFIHLIELQNSNFSTYQKMWGFMEKAEPSVFEDSNEKGRLVKFLMDDSIDAFNVSIFRPFQELSGSNAVIGCTLFSWNQLVLSISLTKIVI